MKLFLTTTEHRIAMYHSENSPSIDKIIIQQFIKNFPESLRNNFQGNHRLSYFQYTTNLLTGE